MPLQFDYWQCLQNCHAGLQILYKAILPGADLSTCGL